MCNNTPKKNTRLSPNERSTACRSVKKIHLNQRILNNTIFPFKNALYKDSVKDLRELVSIKKLPGHSKLRTKEALLGRLENKGLKRKAREREESEIRNILIHIDDISVDDSSLQISIIFPFKIESKILEENFKSKHAQYGIDNEWGIKDLTQFLEIMQKPCLGIIKKWLKQKDGKLESKLDR